MGKQVKPPADFEAFANKAIARKRPGCAACNLPDELKAAITQGRAMSLSLADLCDYITAKGRKLAKATLSEHLRKCGNGR